MGYASPCLPGAIYHNAAKFNQRVLGFVDEFKRSHPDDTMAIFRTFDSLADRCEYGVFWSNLKDSKSVSNAKNWRFKTRDEVRQAIDDKRSAKSKSPATWKTLNTVTSFDKEYPKGARASIDFEWNQSEGQHLYALLDPMAKAIDGKRKADPSFPLLCPRVIGFLLTIPGFPDSDWESLEESRKYLHGMALVNGDGGPFPYMSLLGEPVSQDEIEKLLKSDKEYWKSGRRFNRYHILIDWAYTDEDIVEAFERRILMERKWGRRTVKVDEKRLASEPLEIEKNDKYTLWPQYSFGFKTETMAQASQYYSLTVQDGRFTSELDEISRILDSTKSSSFKGFPEDKRLNEACVALVRKEFGSPDFNLPSFLKRTKKTQNIAASGEITEVCTTEETNRIKFLPKRIAIFCQLYTNGLNLPDSFNTASESLRWTRASIPPVAAD